MDIIVAMVAKFADMVRDVIISVINLLVNKDVLQIVILVITHQLLLMVGTI